MGFGLVFSVINDDPKLGYFESTFSNIANIFKYRYIIEIKKPDAMAQITHNTHFEFEHNGYTILTDCKRATAYYKYSEDVPRSFLENGTYDKLVIQNGKVTSHPKCKNGKVKLL